MKKLIIISVCFLFSSALNSQFIIAVDAGHGWGVGCSNPDGRLSIEMNTAHSVSHKLDALYSGCSNVTVRLTRPSNGCNSWVSLSQRATMANSWGADAFLSIHTNAGGGTGTETFWCNLSLSSNSSDQNFSNTVQSNMVIEGSWNNRRSAEDDSYLNFHLSVLRNTNMNSVLNEIGFGDNTNDYNKLASNTWRDRFALAYYKALNAYLGINCSTPQPNCRDVSTNLTVERDSICKGNFARFRTQSIIPTGAVINRYKWIRNGSVVGGNTDSLVTAFVNDGDLFSCEVVFTDSCGNLDSIKTGIIDMNVFNKDTVVINDVFCVNDIYTHNNKTYDSAGTYYDSVLKPTGCYTITQLVLTNYPRPPLSLTYNNQTISATLGYVNYDWYFNDTLLPTNQNNPSITTVRDGWYKVKVKDINGCTYLDSLLLNTTSIDEITNEANWSIYPNPSTNRIHILFKAKKSLEELELALYNVNGKLIIVKNINLQIGENIFTFDLNELDISKGLYFVSLSQGGKSQYKKVIFE